MSEGTNKERLEQNNGLLETIKLTIDNLPEYTDSGSGDIKLFETEEEMQADPDASEGDLAVVYRNEVQNWNGEGTISGANFANTVVLPSAFTGSTSVSLRSDGGMFDCWGQLSSSSFRVSIYSDSGSNTIQYTSEDGITYTRTDGGDEHIDFGCDAYFEGWGEPWNETLGYFFQIGGNIFEGLYKNITYKNSVQAISAENMSINDETLVISESNVHVGLDIIEKATMAVKNLAPYEVIQSILYLSKDKQKLIFVQIDYGTAQYNYTYRWSPAYYNNKLYIGLTGYAYAYANWEAYQYNIETEEVGTITLTKDAEHSYAPSDESIKEYLSDFDGYLLCTVSYTRGKYNGVSNCNIRYNNDISVPSNTNVEYSIRYKNALKYEYAPTQLTLKATNEILPGKISYGKNGIVTGDNTIYDNLDTMTLMSKILNIEQGSRGFLGEPLECIANVSENSIQYLKQDDNGDKIVIIPDERIVPPVVGAAYVYKGATRYSFNNKVYTISDNTLVKEFSCYNAMLIDDDTYLCIKCEQSGERYTTTIYTTNLEETEVNVLKTYDTPIPMNGDNWQGTTYVRNPINNCIIMQFKSVAIPTSDYLGAMCIYDITRKTFIDIYTLNGTYPHDYYGNAEDIVFAMYHEEDTSKYTTKTYNSTTGELSTLSTSMVGNRVVQQDMFKISDTQYLTPNCVLLDFENNTYTDYTRAVNGVTLGFMQGYKNKWFGKDNTRYHIARIEINGTIANMITDFIITDNLSCYTGADRLTWADIKMNNNEFDLEIGYGTYAKGHGKRYSVSDASDYDIAVINGSVISQSDNVITIGKGNNT